MIVATTAVLLIDQHEGVLIRSIAIIIEAHLVRAAHRVPFQLPGAAWQPVIGEMGGIGQRMSDRFAEATMDTLIRTMSRKAIARLRGAKPRAAIGSRSVAGKRRVEAARQLVKIGSQRRTITDRQRLARAAHD